ncbi:MAG: DUF692 domain-containing protein [Alphaproteobacteria bacterium]|nr:DUF692 domain-containing protein [Alphaproteobacteria bacterium]
MSHPLDVRSPRPLREGLRFPAPRVHGRAGVSFKPEHFAAIMEGRPFGGFFEVHAENYMGAGGPPHRMLTRLRETYPLSVHGVCLSIGGEGPLDPLHLARFAVLVERYEPALVSEHLAWSSHGDVFYNDLLPLPYTHKTLARVCDHIDAVQNAIGRTLLLENPSTYVRFGASQFSETEFLRAIVARTGCGLLLDVNNAFVSAANHGYDVSTYLSDFPLSAVGEIHLAGHRAQVDALGASVLIDSHDCAVLDAVWTLYAGIIAKAGPIPTLIEWDSALPAFEGLAREAAAAQRLLDSVAEDIAGVPHDAA